MISSPFCERGTMGAYRLLVIDVDGTLLDGQSSLRPRTREAIRRAAAAGVVVTLATGRRLRTARPIAAEVGVAVPLIVHNGALIYDTARGAILYERHLPLAVARGVVEIIVAAGFQPLAYENAFRGERLFVGPAEYDGPHTALYLRNAQDQVERRPHHLLLRAEDGDPVRLAVMDEAGRVQGLAEQLASAPGCRILVNTTALMTRHGGLVLEVLEAACSKGAAVAHLAGYFGIPLQHVIAIGDHYNDQEMLRAVGLGVAVANAPADVREDADYVAPSNEDDGVAHVIERFVLGER